MLGFLAPHVVLAGYLALVPDHVAFTLTEAFTLLHVGLGVVSIPFVVAVMLRHARGRLKGVVGLRSLGRRLALASLVGVFISGGFAMWWGDGSVAGVVHTVLGAAFLAPLLLHFLMDHKRHRAVLVWIATVLVAVGFAELIRRTAPESSPNPAVPAFAPIDRRVSDYDSATWCGECHSEIYSEWRRSTHGRALSSKRVRKQIARHPKALGLELPEVIPMENRGQSPPDDICTKCHAPISFYAHESTPPLKSHTVVAEGVTCSFCHTIRAMYAHPVDPSKFMNVAAIAAMRRPLGTRMGVIDHPKSVYYVSAPETVRRYFGQASTNRVLHLLGNLLIRWRPAVHHADYHSEALVNSRACSACHGSAIGMEMSPHRTWETWVKSEQRASDSKTVHCQQCHMVENLAKPRYPVRHVVNWGRPRPRPSHLFLGGNVAQARADGDAQLAQLEERFARAGVKLDVVGVTRKATHLDVEIAVRAPLVGHQWPAMESGVRKPYVALRAFDRTGKVVAKSAPDDRSGLIFFKAEHATDTVTLDTIVPARGKRRLSVSLEVPPEAVRVEVALHDTIGAGLLAAKTVDLPAL